MLRGDVMSNDAASAMHVLMSQIWALFDMPYPGLNMSVKAVILGSFMVCVMINVLRHTFGFGRGSAGPSDRAGGRSVSRARKYDEK